MYRTLRYRVKKKNTPLPQHGDYPITDPPGLLADQDIVFQFSEGGRMDLLALPFTIMHCACLHYRRKKLQEALLHKRPCPCARFELQFTEYAMLQIVNSLLFPDPDGCSIMLALVRSSRRLCECVFSAASLKREFLPTL